MDTEAHRINEQVTFTDGRIIVTGQPGRRRLGECAGYLLRYNPDMPIAVIEARSASTQIRQQSIWRGL